ncbi:MAG TPA: PilT/PilU family type 4a pilus ATPase [Acidimicrobiales bacterium]|jgi:twitching motility protein PilT|nr:PilT/PilU family type 4a pilus ATPase [Acidimicrobiales bacterium]
MVPTSRSVGEFLVTRKVLSRDVLEQALITEAETGVPLAKLLSSEGLVAERDLVAAVADQLGLPMWDPDISPIPAILGGMLPVAMCQRYRAVAVGMNGNELTVAMENPMDQDAVKQISAETGWVVRPVLAAGSDVTLAVEVLYGVESAPTPVADTDEGAAPTPTEVHINELLAEMVEAGASDLHLSAGLPPCIRIDGNMRPMGDHVELTPSEIRRLVYSILTQRQREKFEENLELDTSHPVPNVGRFRLNVFLQRDSVGAVLRAIPYKIVPLEKLGIPAVVGGLANMPRGLVLVTGPTGSGKSTTLASIIDVINTTHSSHIMTVEDPIEFVHSHKRCVVNQREVGEDTKSFSAALKHVLRQDPDVILVGEMRDLETISTALTAAETGHLVFGTLHTQDAPQSIDRVIDVFPAHQQQQIRVQLASALQAVVTQQLVPRAGGRGRAVACEILVVTPAVRNLIREGKVHQIYSAMQGGGKYGMQTMDQSLADLVRAGAISMDLALERCHHEDDLRRLVTGVR